MLDGDYSQASYALGHIEHGKFSYYCLNNLSKYSVRQKINFKNENLEILHPVTNGTEGEETVDFTVLPNDFCTLLMF